MLGPVRRLLRPYRPAPTHDAAQYDHSYRTDSGYSVPYYASRYYPIWTVLADRIARGPERAVLDIGCGPGQLAACLFDLASPTSYTGLDFSTEAIRLARLACPRGTFLQADALAIRYDEIPHDLIVCTEVLEHLSEDLALLSRWRHGLRCLCTVPNFPYESHVRHFTDADEVHARYDECFASLSVWPIRGHQAPLTYFLMDGRLRP